MWGGARVHPRGARDGRGNGGYVPTTTTTRRRAAAVEPAANLNLGRVTDDDDSYRSIATRVQDGYVRGVRGGRVRGGDDREVSVAVARRDLDHIARAVATRRRPWRTRRSAPIAL